MLVYAKTPRGVVHIDGYKIYGKQTGQKPCDVPFDLYKSCRDGLQDATYREGILSKLYGKQFPAVAFTYTELRYVPDKTLNTIGPLMVDGYDESWSHKKKVDQIKKSLANVSPSA